MVTFSESFKDFLRDERNKGSDIARLILGAIYSRFEIPIFNKAVTNAEVDYITMRADGLLSYLPAGKEHKTNERGEWSRDGRQSGKAGKIIRKIFTAKMQRIIPASSFEAFGNAYKAKFMDNGFRWEVKPNTSIIHVYCMERAEGEGPLSGSCMNGDANYLSIYHNCPHVRILVLLNKNGQLCGRALVWNVNHGKHGDIVFMDRIYVAEDYMNDLFLNYAKEQGWWRKVNYTAFTAKMEWVNPTTDEQETLRVSMETPTDFARFPYIDTFSYGNDGTLANSDEGMYTYNNIDGTREEQGREPEEDNEYEDEHENETYDELNDEWIDNDYAVCLSDDSERRYRGMWTHCDSAVEARVTRRNTEWFHQDDSNIVEVNGYWYHIEHDDIVRLADGDFAHHEDTVCCETDSEYYLADDSDLIQSEDGCYYHKENDDDVIYVHATDPREEGSYHYAPDLEEGSVFQEHFSRYWFWTNDARFTTVELHIGYKCFKTFAFKTNVIAIRKKKRTKYYHERDIRITKHTTRYAQAA